MEKIAVLILLLKVICEVQMVNGIHWNITIYIGGQASADSTSTFYLDVNGTRDDKNNISLGTGFRLNENRLISINGDFGEIHSVRIFQYGDDGLFVEKIVLSDGIRQFDLPCYCWIETDDTFANSHPSWTLIPGIHWNITIYIGGQASADSPSTFYLDVNGTRDDKNNISLGTAFRLNENRLISINGDFGEINSVRIFQYGDNALFVEKIVLSDGIRQFDLPCYCWIETDDSFANSHPSWTLIPGIHWNITIYIGGQASADSPSTFYLDVNGTRDDKNNISLGTAFRLNENRLISINGDFGEINSVRIFQYGDNALFVEKIVLSDGIRQFDLPCYCWIETDDSFANSHPSWTLIPGIHWNITIYIGGTAAAPFNSTFYLDVNGTRDDKNNISLGTAFRQNENRLISINGDFGEIHSVRIFQYGDDGLFVEKIVMADGSRQFDFHCDCWIQTDQLAVNSQPSWTLTSIECDWNDLSPKCAEMTPEVVYTHRRNGDRVNSFMYNLGGTNCILDACYINHCVNE